MISRGIVIQVERHVWGSVARCSSFSGLSLENDRRRVRWDIEIAVILVQVKRVKRHSQKRCCYKYYRENAKETDLSRAISYVSFVISRHKLQRALHFTSYLQQTISFYISKVDSSLNYQMCRWCPTLLTSI